MKIAVLQVVAETNQEAETSPSTFWNPATFTEHEVKLLRIADTSPEKDVQAILEQGYHGFIVEAPVDPTISSAVEKIVAQLQSSSVLVLGPSLDFLHSTRVDQDLHSFPLTLPNGLASPSDSSGAIPNGSGNNLRLAVLALRVGPENVVFDPAVLSPGAPSHLSSISDEKLKETVVSNLAQYLKREEHHGAYGIIRIETRVDLDRKVCHVVEINRNPRLWSSSEASTPDDDELVRRTVPGGHATLLDLVIHSQQVASFSQNDTAAVEKKVVDVYAEHAPGYDDGIRELPYYKIMQRLVSDFSWSGSVLDLGCGTGLLGDLLHSKKDPKPFEISGVDLSPDMLAAPAIEKYYQKPITIASIQAAIMRPQRFDHLACFGTLVYLDEVTFNSFLCRMFMVARRSISFDIEDVQAKYLENNAGGSWFLPSHNHTVAFRKFKIPDGWRVVYDRHELLYYDIHSEEEDRGIYDTIVRIERV